MLRMPNALLVYVFDGYAQKKMTPDARRFFDILDCWHKTEFFIPFALSSVTENLGTNQAAFYVSRNEPVAPTDLPVPENTVFSGGDLYLGAFDKDDVQKIVDRLGGETEFEALDRQEREDESWSETDNPVAANTCFARIKLGSAGELQLQSLEISTLPWAIGHALNGNLGNLTWKAFENGKLRLAEQLVNFEMRRRADCGVKNADEPVPLRQSDIEPLLNVFCEWANYWPSRELPLALVRVRFKDIKATEASSTDPAAPLADCTLGNDDFSFPGNENGQSPDDEADGDGLVPEIGILNSFYLTDLELVMKRAEEGEFPNTLREYLTPKAQEALVHVDTDRGKSQIIQMLQPDHVNMGRWPTDPSHSMSLMQQFSINAAFKQLENGGVFSVNGPPGTGKTTLLRDVIAENMVRRARLLAGFKRPEEAFVSRTQITIGDENYDVGNLHPDLTGYEMVVASSNNTAVENISKDLPKAESIFPSDGEPFRYLQPVAHKLAAEWTDKQGKTRFKALDAKDMPWGLIACALGKSKNRMIFRERVLGRDLSDDVRPTWSGKDRPRTLWQWRRLQEEDNARIEFGEAQAAFLTIEQQVLRRQQELQAFAQLHQDAMEGRLEVHIEEISRLALSAETDFHKQDRFISEVKASLSGKQNELSDLREVQAQIDRLRPSFLEALLRRGRKRDYDALTRENAAAQINLRHEITRLNQQLSADLEPERDEAQKNLKSLDAELASAKCDLEARDFRLIAFQQQYPDVIVLKEPADIDKPDIQRRGLWHDKTFNNLRSDLFKAAMKLHEAWLAAVSRSKRLRYHETMRAIAALLDGKQLEDASHYRTLWQNFFMIVPVVSTTFASFARQFRGLSEGSLGWVLIDEAGQAVPQAAVGAMFRAKRALVIGDPLQIEPVLTLAKPLIKGLCDLSEYTRDGFYSPASTSVQVLSDSANIFGELLGSDDKDIWIGSPLRVHRRCLDPIFSIANKIAYNGKMVHGLPNPHPGQEKAPILMPSCWVNIGGKVSGKQTVPEQVRFASAIVVDCYKQAGKLPDLYLISPFKEVKAALNRELTNLEIWERAGINRPANVSDLLKARVGTVHTFQGKEEDTVVMVLGTDADHVGAARWAASKPNILNVAITRSKRRFYIVGDKQLWGGLRYFKDAAAGLPTVSNSEFWNQGRGAR